MSTTSGTGIGTSETTVNQKVGMVFGAVYILVGIMGFFVGGGFAGQEGALLLGIFEVNILHSIVHLAIGLALIGAARAGDNAARTTNMAIGALYLALGVLGWFIEDTALNIVALNSADHILHLASGALLVAVSRAGATARTQVA